MARATHPAFEHIENLRAEYKADLVGLVVNTNKYCGCSYNYNGKARNGFFMTSRNCMTGYYSFGHEIGHNMVSANTWRKATRN